MGYKTLINFKNKLSLVLCRKKRIQNTHRFKYVKILKLGTLFRNKYAGSGKCWGLLNYSAKCIHYFFYLY